MKRVFVLTAYNRPEYLRPTLESLRAVRGWEDWHVLFSVEPSDRTDEIVQLIEEYLPFFRERTRAEIWVNPVRLGVLHHPWVLFNRLFQGFEDWFEGQAFDYVLRSEDDLIHAADVLEFHSWASQTYRDDAAVGIVGSFTYAYRDRAEVHRRIGMPSPLLIGTWPEIWSGVLRDTWDHDYSTGSGDVQGWDHNINLRVFPEHGLHTLVPNHPKVEHIGVYGAHSTPEIFFVQRPFDPAVPPQEYHEVPL